MKSDIENESNNILSLDLFYANVENLDRACSTVIENSTAIFLPHKRLDKSSVQKKFYEQNQILEIKSDLFNKVEIRGRLLCQTHKDILEILLTSPKTYNEEKKTFSVKVTAYHVLKRLGKYTSNKKWLSQKLSEIAECRIEIEFQDNTKKSRRFNFGFIETISKEDEKEFTIRFLSTYSYFMAKNEMIDYSNHVENILQIKNPFISSIVRYMLTHKGNNSQISIEKLIVKLSFKDLISNEQLKDNITELKRKKTQEMLKEKFGIVLTNQEKTVTYNSINFKQIIQPKLDI